MSRFVLIPALAALLVGCNGSDDSSVDLSSILSSDAGSNEFTASAGYGRIAPVGASVQLKATVANAEGNLSLSWQQTSGTPVTLDDPSIADPSFVAPSVAASELLVFELTAGDGSTTPIVDEVWVEIWVPYEAGEDLTVIVDFSDRPSWQCDQDPTITPEVTFTTAGAYVTVQGNGIPSHATGTFPNAGNPNTITDFYQTRYLPATPEKTITANDMAEFGVTVDGVKLERDTAESYQNLRQWHYEAVTAGVADQLTPDSEWSWLGTDCNNAHVQPTGSYHYHGLPESLINRLGEGNDTPADMILGGYAADGFPFYLRYGYADAEDPNSGLVAIEASWELKSGARPSGPGGAYDGTFREDWEYVQGSGDVDECGGRFGPTPEYPGGIYHYYLTDDYPFIPRCVFGTPDASFRRR